jgi:hypothetical protein
MDLRPMILTDPLNQALRISDHPVFHVFEFDRILCGEYIDFWGSVRVESSPKLHARDLFSHRILLGFVTSQRIHQLTLTKLVWMELSDVLQALETLAVP